MTDAGLSALGKSEALPAIRAFGRAFGPKIKIDQRMAQSAAITAYRGGFHNYGL